MSGLVQARLAVPVGIILSTTSGRICLQKGCTYLPYVTILCGGAIEVQTKADNSRSDHSFSDPNFSSLGPNVPGVLETLHLLLMFGQQAPIKMTACKHGLHMMIGV